MSAKAGQGTAMPGLAHDANQINSRIIRPVEPRPDPKAPAFLHPSLALRRVIARAHRVPLPRSDSRDRQQG